MEGGKGVYVRVWTCSCGSELGDVVACEGSAKVSLRSILV